MDSWVGKIHWRRDRLPMPMILGFPCGSAGKESTCNAGDLSSIPRSGKSPRERNGKPLSTLAWKIPWMEEPGRLQSMGSQRVGHNKATSLSLFTLMHWRRKWQPTPVLLPGISHGWRSVIGYSPLGHKEADTTEQIHIHKVPRS